MTLRSAFVATGATLSLVASPSFAAELPVSTQRSAVAPAASYDIGAETAQRDRYRGYRGHHRGHNRVDAGDVIAGVVILGGIAAIASAASRNNRDRVNYPDRRYPTNVQNYDRSSGIDRAVSQCMREVERDARVGGVDGVTRSGSGWQVNGSLYNGEGFVCRIGANGRIEGVDYGFSGAYSDPSGGAYQPSSVSGPDQQWDDSAYSRARMTAGYSQPDVPGAQPAYSSPAYAPPAQTSGPQPAYPGGPLPGEQYADDDGYGG